ncbi:MAG: hypothetical protein N5P05_000232 [Chroococcopsis gigantea SAG 12.99]|jgi:hypothetical protein|nr:hypothetical protein [Chroococcopsis gigantea SAG 12.99]
MIVTSATGQVRKKNRIYGLKGSIVHTVRTIGYGEEIEGLAIVD